MKPNKAKDLIPEVVKCFDLEESKIKTILNSFWSEVRKKASGLEYTRIHIENLGDLSLKHWLLDEEIRKLEYLTEYYPKESIRQGDISEKLGKVRDIKSKFEEEQQRKAFIKYYKKNGYVSKGKSDSNMEEQEPDPGGCEKLDI